MVRARFLLFSKHPDWLRNPIQPPIHYETGFFPRAYGSHGWKLTTHLHLVTRVRMSGDVLLLPHYAFMVWTGTTLPSSFQQF